MGDRVELPLIQRTYDFVLWAVPLLGRLPRDHTILLGDRIEGHLCSLLHVRYAHDAAVGLEAC